MIMELINRFNTALDDGLTDSVFSHVRNYIVFSLLLAIGFVAFHEEQGLFFGQFIFSYYTGIELIGL